MMTTIITIARRREAVTEAKMVVATAAAAKVAIPPTRDLFSVPRSLRHQLPTRPPFSLRWC